MLSRPPVTLDDLRLHDIPGWDGNKINRVGQVWSYPRQTRYGWRGGQIVEIGGQKTRARKELKPYIPRNGRPQVILNSGGRKKTFRVDRLMAMTFKDERPPGWHICHQDEDRAFNWIINLEYGSAEVNHLAYVASGRAFKPCCPQCGGEYQWQANGSRRRCRRCVNKAQRARRARLKAER